MIKIIAPYKLIYLLFLIFLQTIVWGQSGYSFRRKLEGERNEMWCTIPFKNNGYQILKSSHNFRILGFTAQGDTVEAPYFLNENLDNESFVNSDFKLLNQTFQQNGYFFTFENELKQPINEIQLNFENDNFDWKIDLEGSQNQNEWFKVVENQRFVGLKNESVTYQFSTIRFPLAQFRYWRLRVKTNEKPRFLSASLQQRKTTKGKIVAHQPLKMNVNNDKNAKTTTLLIELADVLPISQLEFYLNHSFDYMRNFQCQYLEDTLNQYWRYFESNNISSLKKNIFDFKTILTNKIRIIIDNDDNTALQIDSIGLRGNPMELIARLPVAADYFLYYGSNQNTPPQYDLKIFKNNIPANRGILELGAEEKLVKSNISKTFWLTNKWWLWAIMLIIILVLGLQTFKMIKTIK